MAAPWTDAQRHEIQKALARPLGPQYLAQREGPGGSKLLYIEGWRQINVANDVFGFDKWSTEVKSVDIDFVEKERNGLFSIGAAAVVRVTLASGSFHENCGYGNGQSKRKAQAFENARKSAVTDATKRALIKFGNVLGNNLSDPNYKKFISQSGKKQLQQSSYSLGTVHTDQHRQHLREVDQNRSHAHQQPRHQAPAHGAQGQGAGRPHAMPSAPARQQTPTKHAGAPKASAPAPSSAAGNTSASCAEDNEEYLDEETLLLLAASVAEEAEADDPSSVTSAPGSCARGKQGAPHSAARPAKRVCTEQ